MILGPWVQDTIASFKEIFTEGASVFCLFPPPPKPLSLLATLGHAQELFSLPKVFPTNLQTVPFDDQGFYEFLPLGIKCRFLSSRVVFFCRCCTLLDACQALPPSESALNFLLRRILKSPLVMVAALSPVHSSLP